MLTKIILSAHTQRIYSSRQIAKAVRENIHYVAGKPLQRIRCCKIGWNALSTRRGNMSLYFKCTEIIKDLKYCHKNDIK
nr:hypothetical protein [Paenibacillus fonticola]